jgi:ADP-ribose pyrophosphatase
MSNPKTVSAEHLYRGRVIDLIIEEVQEATGEIRKREIVHHNGGGVVIPLFENREILLVKQYRYPFKKFVIEAPAGKLELNEDPLVGAKRELLEETGYTAQKFEKLTAMYTTPGFCDEVLHIYLATGLQKSLHGQQLDEGEYNLTLERVPLSNAIEMIERQEIVDSKTIAGIFLTERKLKAIKNEHR